MSVSGAGDSSPAPGPAMFGDRLAAAVAARESQIVLGIDPDPARLWPHALERTSEARASLAQALAGAHESARGVIAAADERAAHEPASAADERWRPGRRSSTRPPWKRPPPCSPTRWR